MQLSYMLLKSKEKSEWAGWFHPGVHCSQTGLLRRQHTLKQILKVIWLFNLDSDLYFMIKIGL